MIDLSADFLFGVLTAAFGAADVTVGHTAAHGCCAGAGDAADDGDVLCLVVRRHTDVLHIGQGGILIGIAHHGLRVVGTAVDGDAAVHRRLAAGTDAGPDGDDARLIVGRERKIRFSAVLATESQPIGIDTRRVAHAVIGHGHAHAGLAGADLPGHVDDLGRIGRRFAESPCMDCAVFHGHRVVIVQHVPADRACSAELAAGAHAAGHGNELAAGIRMAADGIGRDGRAGNASFHGVVHIADIHRSSHAGGILGCAHADRRIDHQAAAIGRTAFADFFHFIVSPGGSAGIDAPVLHVGFIGIAALTGVIGRHGYGPLAGNGSAVDGRLVGVVHFAVVDGSRESRRFLLGADRHSRCRGNLFGVGGGIHIHIPYTGVGAVLDNTLEVVVHIADGHCAAHRGTAVAAGGNGRADATGDLQVFIVSHIGHRAACHRIVQQQGMDVAVRFIVGNRCADGHVLAGAIAPGNAEAQTGGYFRAALDGSVGQGTGSGHSGILQDGRHIPVNDIGCGGAPDAHIVAAAGTGPSLHPVHRTGSGPGTGKEAVFRTGCYGARILKRQFGSIRESRCLPVQEVQGHAAGTGHMDAGARTGFCILFSQGLPGSRGRSAPIGDLAAQVGHVCRRRAVLAAQFPIDIIVHFIDFVGNLPFDGTADAVHLVRCLADGVLDAVKGSRGSVIALKDRRLYGHAVDGAGSFRRHGDILGCNASNFSIYNGLCPGFGGIAASQFPGQGRAFGNLVGGLFGRLFPVAVRIGDFFFRRIRIAAVVRHQGNIVHIVVDQGQTGSHRCRRLIVPKGCAAGDTGDGAPVGAGDIHILRGSQGRFVIHGDHAAALAVHEVDHAADAGSPGRPGCIDDPYLIHGVIRFYRYVLTGQDGILPHQDQTVPGDVLDGDAGAHAHIGGGIWRKEFAGIAGEADGFRQGFRSGAYISTGGCQFAVRAYDDGGLVLEGSQVDGTGQPQGGAIAPLLRTASLGLLLVHILGTDVVGGIAVRRGEGLDGADQIHGIDGRR